MKEIIQDTKLRTKSIKDKIVEVFEIGKKDISIKYDSRGGAYRININGNFPNNKMVKKLLFDLEDSTYNTYKEYMEPKPNHEGFNVNGNLYYGVEYLFVDNNISTEKRLEDYLNSLSDEERKMKTDEDNLKSWMIAENKDIENIEDYDIWDYHRSDVIKYEENKTKDFLINKYGNNIDERDNLKTICEGNEYKPFYRTRHDDLKQIISENLTDRLKEEIPSFEEEDRDISGITNKFKIYKISNKIITELIEQEDIEKYFEDDYPWYKIEEKIANKIIHNIKNKELNEIDSDLEEFLYSENEEIHSLEEQRDDIQLY